MNEETEPGLRDLFAAQANVTDLTREIAVELMQSQRPLHGAIAQAEWDVEAEARYRYMKADAMVAVRDMDLAEPIDQESSNG